VLTGYGSSTAACVGGEKPTAVGWRSGGGRRLGGHGAAVNSGRGCGGVDGVGGWPVRIAHDKVLTVKEVDGIGWHLSGGRLGSW
jgi:hypothetical protein